MLEQFLNQAVGIVWNYPVIILCLFTGVYFTVFKFQFIQFRCFKHAFDLLRGRYDDPDEIGEITHFQALSAALSGTIGLGNIAGVAIAIALGGPGAVLWMWIVGILGMATKYVECTLGTKYRHENAVTKEAYGGPMYYIEKGLGKKWKPLAIFFAICAGLGAFGAGGMFQANQTASALETFYQIPKAYTGITLSILVSLVIIGGIKRIGNVASRIVPSMCLIYVVGSLVICVMNIDKIPFVFSTIITDAFTGQAAAGGSIGAVILMGVRRAVFSNEAGLGSASIAHAAVKTHFPIREGIVASLGPLIDTVIVCTATAAVIIMSGFYGTELYERKILLSDFENTELVRNLDDNGSWSVTTESPNEGESIRQFKSGTQVLEINNIEKPSSKIALAPIPSIVDYTRISYFKDSGRLAVRVKDDKGTMILEFPLGETTKVTLPKWGDIEKTAVTVIGYPKSQQWQSFVFHWSDDFKALLKKRNSASFTLEMIPLGGNVHWYFDRHEAVTKRSGIGLTIAAYDQFFHGFGTIFITLAVTLFAFSTMVTWSYYGEVATIYALGKKAILPFKFLFVVLIFYGSIKGLALVLSFTDLMTGLMVLPNMIAIIPLSKQVKVMTEEYLGKLKAGEFQRFK